MKKNAPHPAVASAALAVAMPAPPPGPTPDVFVRMRHADRPGKYYFRLPDGLARSTGVTAPLPEEFTTRPEWAEQQREHARGVAATMLLRHGAVASGWRDPHRTRVAEVLREQFGPDGHEDDLRSYGFGSIPEATAKGMRNRWKRVSRIAEACPDWLLPDVTPQTCRLMLSCLRGTPVTIAGNAAALPEESRPLAFNSARRALSDMRAGVEDWGFAHGVPQLAQPWVPDEAPVEHVPLARSDVARLLLACRGRIWDPETGGWKFDVSVDPATGETRRSYLIDREAWPRFRCVARQLLLGLYSGGRDEVGREAMWLPDPDFGYIDAAEGIWYRDGYRRPANAHGMKSRPATQLQPRLAVLVAAWAKADARRGHTYVLSDADGRPLGDNASRLWRSVVARAGLRYECRSHDAKRTGATWHAMGAMPLAELAALFATSETVLRRHYILPVPHPETVPRGPLALRVRICSRGVLPCADVVGRKRPASLARRTDPMAAPAPDPRRGAFCPRRVARLRRRRRR